MQNVLPMLVDSYKVSHGNMMPTGSEYVYSYYEARLGAKWDNVNFFGLQAILKKYLVGVVITQENIDKMAELCEGHFGNKTAFNRAGWQHILTKHGGKLPIRIKAVAEGKSVEVGNALMTIENTDPKCFWLTSYLESLLSHVWYPTTICSQSGEIKKMLVKYLNASADSLAGIDFMLHDFSFRSVTCAEAGAIGSLAHIVHFLGTDSVIALQAAIEFYGHKGYKDLAYSVPASEHSVGTSMGRQGETGLVKELLNKYPTGILSLVADSFDFESFVENIIGVVHKEQILNREGIVVVRPDSLTPNLTTPEAVAVWTQKSLYDSFPGEYNRRGMKVLNKKLKVLMGDGLDKDKIERILQKTIEAGFSVENLVFGCGSGLLQRVNRDDCRFAMKSSAQCRNGVWFDISKEPTDTTKISKKGKFKLVLENGKYQTVNISDPRKDELETVFENGELKRDMTFQQVRDNAKLTPNIQDTV